MRLQRNVRCCRSLAGDMNDGCSTHASMEHGKLDRLAIFSASRLQPRGHYARSNSCVGSIKPSKPYPSHSLSRSFSFQGRASFSRTRMEQSPNEGSWASGGGGAMGPDLRRGSRWTRECKQKRMQESYDHGSHEQCTAAAAFSPQSHSHGSGGWIN